MRLLTSDVFCGAYLLARGATLVDLLIDRSGRRESGTFVFEGPESLLAHQEAYSRGTATANVKELRQGVTALRGRLARALARAA